MPRQEGQWREVATVVQARLGRQKHLPLEAWRIEFGSCQDERKGGSGEPIDRRYGEKVAVVLAKVRAIVLGKFPSSKVVCSGYQHCTRDFRINHAAVVACDISGHMHGSGGMADEDNPRRITSVILGVVEQEFDCSCYIARTARPLGARSEPIIHVDADQPASDRPRSDICIKHHARRAFVSPHESSAVYEKEYRARTCRPIGGIDVETMARIRAVSDIDKDFAVGRPRARSVRRTQFERGVDELWGKRAA